MTTSENGIKEDESNVNFLYAIPAKFINYSGWLKPRYSLFLLFENRLFIIHYSASTPDVVVNIVYGDGLRKRQNLQFFVPVLTLRQQNSRYGMQMITQRQEQFGLENFSSEVWPYLERS